MFKTCPVCIFFLVGYLFYPQDSIQKKIHSNEEIRQGQLQTIKIWENIADRHLRNGDLSAHMQMVMDIIYFKINDLGDHITSYEDALYLQDLIEENPEVEKVAEIQAPLNFFMGVLIREQGQIAESVSFYESAINYAKPLNQEEYYIDASVHLAEVLGRLGKDERALQIFDDIEAETKAKSMLYPPERVYEYRTTFHLNKGEYDLALKYALKSIQGDAAPKQRATRLSYVSKTYFLLGKQLDSAVYYGEMALKDALENGQRREEFLAHENLRDAYGKLGNYEKAFYHFTKFYEFDKEQNSYESALKIGALNTEREKEKAQLQEEYANQRLSNQRLIIWGVSGGLLLLIFGLLFIFNRLKFIRKQNKIIEQEKFRAEQSERYKEQFLANMSHEIRTPMHAISGMLNAIKRQPHPKSQDNFLNAMKVSADNLLVILNDVLDMSKIESGNLDMEQVPMSVGHVIKHVVNVFKFKAEEKGLDLKTIIAEDFPQYIMGDPGRLNQILLNLVSNAIKFTYNGGINITVGKIGDTYRIEVLDTGTGLSKEEARTLFESFKQGENVSKGKHGGTGLGLAICKQLIELQGGEIWAESELGRGSTFIFELPLIIAEGDRETQVLYSEEELKVMGQELKGARILIAEDNPFNVMVVNDDLSWYIPEVNLTFAENGVETINKFKSESFDIILMDVQMPEMDGYEATKSIRNMEIEESLERIPIIAMTASLLKDQIDRCYEAGMDAYVPKPYKPEELLSAIKTVLAQ